MMRNRMKAARGMASLLVLSTLFSCAIREKALYTFDLNEVAEKSGPASLHVMEITRGKSSALHLKASPGADPLVLCADGDSLPWTEANYLTADMVHEMPYGVAVWIHFFERGGGGVPRISSKMGILPGLPTRLVLPLEYLDGQTFFMARQERRLKGVMPGNRLPKDRIGRVTLELFPNTDGFESEIWLSNLRLMKEKPEPPGKSKRVVDSLGQWKARDWPGKTKSEKEMTANLKRLDEESAGREYPDSWNAYGGWKGRVFRKTGFFRTQFDGGRWWLVDPEGCAFFSVGIDVMTPDAFGPVNGMTDLLDWLPDKKSVFAPAFETHQGWTSFSYYTANLVRAFGTDWEMKWRSLARNLMREWRFNTVGNWSDRNFINGARMPYVFPLQGFPSTRTLLYRDFPDVFSREYRDKSIQFAGQLEAVKDDAFLIGYFLDNEPLWAFGSNNVASEMLASARPSETKRAFAAWLKKRYHGDAKRFASAWNLHSGSVDSLFAGPIPNAATLSVRAGEDCWAFTKIMVREYLKHPSEALRKADPNHLNLGIRYGGISSDLCYEACEYFDVFSINMYTEKPDGRIISEITRRTGRPVMIGEFHHGSIDRGLPSTGIRGVASQADRGVGYRYYVEQGAGMPSLVGIHLFQLNDQPVLGRDDGENYNIGLLDVCVKPYGGFTEQVASTNQGIYDVVSGKRKPSNTRAVTIPAIYF
jgi:hypothetical protein